MDRNITRLTVKKMKKSGKYSVKRRNRSHPGTLIQSNQR